MPGLSTKLGTKTFVYLRNDKLLTPSVFVHEELNSFYTQNNAILTNMVSHHQLTHSNSLKSTAFTLTTCDKVDAFTFCSSVWDCVLSFCFQKLSSILSKGKSLFQNNISMHKLGYTEEMQQATVIREMKGKQNFHEKPAKTIGQKRKKSKEAA